MVMTRAQFARDLEDGLNAHFGMEYDTHEPQYTQIFDTKTSRRAFEDQILRVGLGEAVEKAEGAVVTFDTGAEGWISRATFHTYALAFAITEEAIEDNLYADLSEVYSKELALALQHAKEVRGANYLNHAFDSSFIGGDGVSLCASSHPLWVGGGISNKLATPADLSEDSIEDALIAINGFVNDRGRPIVIKPDCLILPRQLEFVAHRILRSNGRVGTANNDTNALKDMSAIPGGVKVNNYLSDPDAWWIKTKAKMGLQYWKRRGVKKKFEEDFKTGNFFYKVSERFGFSWTDWRTIYGSEGSPIA